MLSRCFWNLHLEENSAEQFQKPASKQRLNEHLNSLQLFDMQSFVQYKLIYTDKL